ncbi:MAG: AmmeMemoRadiSam system radical SAM enzyme [Spirochaetota bacterium]
MNAHAMYYEIKQDKKVRCLLCPNSCVITPGNTGLCGIRKNQDGTLYSTIYGEVSSMAMDPIEKKPLYHFFPGTHILSIGTVGCSLKCRFCQNYGISQNPDHPTDYYRPQDIVEFAVARGSVGIAYTYNEPFIWYEFVRDTCILAQKRGLKNVFVTNGYVNQLPLKGILPYADAFNVDLKSMDDQFYRKIISGKLQPVLDTITEISGHPDIILEVTTLVIPGYNDSGEEMEKFTGFLSSLSPDIPYHLSAYFPMYQFEAPPTSVRTLQTLKHVAEMKMRYVYLGNVGGAGNTLCHNCGAVLVERMGYSIKKVNCSQGKCKNCGSSVPIIG